MNYDMRLVKSYDCRDAVFSDYPEAMHDDIKNYLKSRGINYLYSHQAEMFNSALERNNIVITTATASGKTLSFLLPVLQELLRKPSSRAIFLYPTKALANDQYRAMYPIVKFFGDNRISIGVYDGDTSINERRRIRNSANIILTNPDMLNSAFLPNHSKYGFDFVFSNLRFVVIDELHSYRGAFGAHLANVFRRMSRICNFYNSAPQFLCSSATIANPLELAEKVCGQPFVLIDNDGSSSSKKDFYFLQPSCIKGTDIPKSVTSVATEIIPSLLFEGHRFISFCRSRKAVEVVLKETRDKLCDYNNDYTSMISGYRGGYKPEERKAIEEKMISGEIAGLISTNALELGIDIGAVDTSILVSYPGTRASFWQQAGRAGRNGKESTIYLILDDVPFDQYINHNPDWLFDNSSENVVVDSNNLFIQIAHIRAAAAELPLSLDDMVLFPDLGEIIPELMRAGELINCSGKFMWSGKDFPAGDYSLRNIDKTRFKLISSINNEVITEMDELQAIKEIHNRSIYMHDGQSYLVTSFNSENCTALAEPANVNYYTDTQIQKSITIIKEHKYYDFNRSSCHFGDVTVSCTVSGHKKIQLHNRQNLGYEKLDEPLRKSIDTEGVWIDIPENVYSVYKALSANGNSNNERRYIGYLDATAYALKNSAMMLTMTTNSDLDFGVIISYSSSENMSQTASVCMHDMYIGGIGYAEKVYELIKTTINNAIDMISSCRCKNGCAACIGDHHLDKKVVIWGLKNLFEETPPPVDIKQPENEERKYIDKPFSFEDVVTKWDEIVKFISEHESKYSRFLTTIKSVRCFGTTLVLLVESEFVKQWVLNDEIYNSISNILTYYIDVPEEFIIDIDIDPNSGINTIRNDKIARRLSDLKNT